MHSFVFQIVTLFLMDHPLSRVVVLIPLGDAEDKPKDNKPVGSYVQPELQDNAVRRTSVSG